MLKIGERKMLKKFVSSAVIAVLLMSTFAFLSPASAQLYPQPRLDEIYMKVISDPDAATTAFQIGEVDVNPDMIRWANVEKLINEGHQVLSMGGFHMCYLGINTRSYVPDDAGQPDPGRSLAPLNWTSFRLGLAWAALSETEKEAAILKIYGGPINIPLMTVVPPALGVWWNYEIDPPGCNFTKAWEIMQAGGFYKVGTTLYQPNDVPVRDTIEVLSPLDAPTSMEFTREFTHKWNNFTQTFLGVTNALFVQNDVLFGPVLVPRAFQYRDFDIYFLCWGLSRFPTFLYNFFHSSFEGEWENNSCGIQDAELDALLETIQFGLVYSEKVDACWAAQELIVEQLVPYVPIYSRTYYNAFAKRSETHYLTNKINMGGFGADNEWTWAHMHWADQPVGGSVGYVLGSAPVNLHPGWASSAYEWDILSKLFVGMIATTPDLGDLPFGAGNWSTEAFDWPALNIYDGTKVRFQLRSDLYWHDGQPVTIEDVKFAFDFMENFPRYKATWQYHVWSDVIDPCTIEVYMNVTSQWVAYQLAGIALLFPKHMYGPGGWLESNGHDPVNAAVWTIPYTVGNARKALIGCGQYIFDYWDPALNIAHVVKNPDYFIWVPVLQAFEVYRQRVNPGVTLHFYVWLINYSPFPIWVNDVDITANGAVIENITGPILMMPFSAQRYGPYHHTFPMPGPAFLDCHTFFAEEPWVADYYFPIYVTVPEDLNYDYEVDIYDLVIVGLAIGAVPGDPNWDSRADIVRDYGIDIFDLVSVALQLGWGSS